MRTPKIPDNEIARLQALRQLEVLDPPPEPRFDCITGIAQHLFEMPIVLIRLIDSDIGSGSTADQSGCQCREVLTAGRYRAY